MTIRGFTISIVSFIVAVIPATVLAQDVDPLMSVYARRGDLQRAFDSETHLAVSGTTAGFLIDLEDWARQYGWQEHPELSAYGPGNGNAIPIRIDTREIEDQIGAQAYVVMDRASGKILTVKRENLQWPIASLTKLVTADVVLSEGVASNQIQSVRNSDNVGGARLWVNDGDTFSVNDLFYAALVASANNAANALSRSVGLDREDFLEKMNDRARSLNLTKTHFVDPTGIELGNVSTPREMARLARQIFLQDRIRQYTSTASRNIRVQNTGSIKKMINTNWMLWKPQYDDVYVTGGKTGYLNESGWNLVVNLQPSASDEDRELLMVVFGAKSRAESFKDANQLADWAWDTHQWVKQQ